MRCQQALVWRAVNSQSNRRVISLAIGSNYGLPNFQLVYLFFALSVLMAAPARTVDWQPLRDAFVKRSPRPTFTELSEEFSVPITTISNCANEEAWGAMRAEFLESKLRAADAAGVLLEAIKIDRALIRAVADLALTALNSVKHEIGRLTDDKAASTNVEVLNTASFCAVNFARALRECGIIGLPKGMGEEGKEANGRWNPEMLQQINVTVQNLTAQQAKDQPVIPVAVAKADPPGDLPKKAE